MWRVRLLGSGYRRVGTRSSPSRCLPMALGSAFAKNALRLAGSAEVGLLSGGHRPIRERSSSMVGHESGNLRPRPVGYTNEARR